MARRREECDVCAGGGSPRGQDKEGGPHGS